MIKKVLKVVLFVFAIGFVSAFFRGYTSLYDNKKQVQHSTEQQEMINQDTINAILNTDIEISKKKQ